MLMTQLFIALALVDAVPIIAVGISLYMIFAL
jgi:F0F1-type ATP synthase membrane subunit c/vacuolar-type H+-ATPase subunit K